MANLLLSGWLAASFNLLTTELNTLANGAYAISTVAGSSGVLDNGSNKYPNCHVEFLAGGNYTPLANGYIPIWLLESLDGTNYDDGSASIVPARRPDITISVRAGTTITPRGQAKGLLMPQGLYKVLAANMTGATFPSSGNVIVARPGTVAI